MNDEDTRAPDIVTACQISSYPTKITLDKDGKVLLRIVDPLNVEIDERIKAIPENEPGK